MHAAKSFAAVARVLRRAETHRRTRNLSDGMAVSAHQQWSNAMSSSGFPSMTALLGLLAVAGYQNRDKIAEMLRGAGQGASGAGPGGPGGSSGPGGLGGVLEQLRGSLGGGNAGGFLSSGLGELIDRFKQNGQ